MIDTEIEICIRELNERREALRAARKAKKKP
jgi:hypothetical protein